MGVIQYFALNCPGLSMHYSCDTAENGYFYELHAHEYCELFCFLGGKGHYKIEGTSYPLHVGDVLVIRPEEAHNIDIDPCPSYSRISIHFSPYYFDSFGISKSLLAPFFDRKPGQFNLYNGKIFESEMFLEYITALCSDTGDRRAQTVSALLGLLNEIRIAFNKRDKEETEGSTIHHIIEYINENLDTKITLDEISEKFFISKPTLCRKFKTATGSSLWDYVTAKRLALARRLIANGTPPTKLYALCGFSDYSAFYRAYKKRYGVSPNKPSDVFGEGEWQ